MTVKVSLIPNDFSQDLEAIFKLCNEENVNYVELASMWDKSILDLSKEEDQKVKDLLEKYGLKAGSIQTQIGKVWAPSSPNNKKSRSMHNDYEFNISRLDRAIELAEFLDAKYIVCYGFRGRNEKDKVTREQYWKELIEMYAGFMDRLKAADKTMVIESDNGQLIGNAEDYLRIIEHFNSPHLQANLDLCNLSQVKSLNKEEFDRLHTHVPYFHCKDRYIASSKKGLKKIFAKRGPALFGEGDVAWETVLGWFRDAGDFNSILSIEPHVAGPNKIEKGRKCVQNLQAMLKKLNIKYE